MNLFSGNRRHRAIALCVLTLLLAPVLILRLFLLQIRRGDAYREELAGRLTREVTVPGKRGRILDRSGKVLADTRTIRNVTLTDTTTTYDAAADELLNSEIAEVIRIVEDGKGKVSDTFSIGCDGTDYRFLVSDWELQRFLADVYGYADIADMTEEEKSKSAEDVIMDLRGRFGITTSPDTPEEARLLWQQVLLRYQLSLHTYQRYVPTTLAMDLDEETAREILAREEDLPGVSIATTYARDYRNAPCFSGILGYMGEASEEEAAALSGEEDTYRAGDQIGKTGTERSMEQILHGKSGRRKILVDSMGREIELLDAEPAQDGSDVYLTIDRDLQEAAYTIAEHYVADILLDRLYDSPEIFEIDADLGDSRIRIPSGDAYAAILNNVVDKSHFSSSGASDTEQQILQAAEYYRDNVREGILWEIDSGRTPYKDLSLEYQGYEFRLVQSLYSANILVSDRIDTGDSVYRAWTEDETASLTQFLEHAVSEEWIDTESLGLSKNEHDSAVIFDALRERLQKVIDSDRRFTETMYRHMIANRAITGEQVLRVLCEQKAAPVNEEEREDLLQGRISAYQFLRNRIRQLNITPAQLELNPCTASVVLTDIETGDVLALVSYPGYDNSRIHEETYYRQLLTAHSPLTNTATQLLTAPGSTFKMVSTAAGLGEGVVGLHDWLPCRGIFRKIDPSPKCWIWPGGHGALDPEGAIANSCNCFFYEVGYRLGGKEEGSTGEPDNGLGTERLRKYIHYFGLDTKTGIEMEESDPVPASKDIVRACIGQSDNRYTTVGLARYAAAVARRGPASGLTIIDRTIHGDGTETAVSAVGSGEQEVVVSDETWDAIHAGMRRVIAGKSFFYRLGDISVSGKTGTAEHGAGSPSHVLFTGFAPSEDPEISIAVRIPNGYSSDYAAQLGEKVLEYYYEKSSLEEILAVPIIGYTTSGD